jgi:hypothetical protein
MIKDRKTTALAAWRRMREEPQLHLDPEELYEILINMANSLERDRIISTAEWLQLVRDASTLLVDS